MNSALRGVVTAACMSAIGAVLGVVAVGISAYVGGTPRIYDTSMVPWLRTVWEGQSPLIALLLLLVGSLSVALLRPRFWFAVGISTMAVFWLLSAVELAANTGSHNLWPIEWGLYFLWSIPGFVGAASAWAVFIWRRSIRERHAG